jgi:hypothetical protein
MVVLGERGHQSRSRRRIRIDSLEADDGGPVVARLGLLESRSHGREVVVAIVDTARGRQYGNVGRNWRYSHEDLPSVRLEPLANVLSEGDGGGSVDRDVVVVVDGDEVAKLEVTARVNNSQDQSSKVRSRCDRRGKTYPARDAASEEIPSIRQPSPVNM